MLLELTGFGFEQKNICSYLCINDDTLCKYYREEINAGKIQVNMEVMQPHMPKPAPWAPEITP